MIFRTRRIYFEQRRNCIKSYYGTVAIYDVILKRHMVKLTREEVLKLAKLAKLSLTDSEVEQFTKEISEILGYVEQLQKINVSRLEPTYQVTGLTNVMRKDEIRQYEATPKELLKNAPAVEAGQIKVKRVL